MRKHAIFGVLLGAAMLQTMPVTAGYTRDEITLRLQPLVVHEGDAVLCDDGSNRILMTEEMAKHGAKLHYGVFIDADRAELSMIYLEVRPDSEGITFDGTDFRNPKLYEAETPQEYLLPDGTTFSSKFYPYCLGVIDESGTYAPRCFACLENFEEPDVFRLMWMHGFGNSTSFLGGRSDLRSFVEFDVDIAPGLSPGTHNLLFVANTEPGVMPDQSPTYVTTDESDGGPSKYTDVVPGLKNAEIVVGVRGDVNFDGRVDASDAARILSYSAKAGASGGALFTDGRSDTFEQFACQMADVTAMQEQPTEINASDAACILIYAAAEGTGNPKTWNEIVKSDAK